MKPLQPESALTTENDSAWALPLGPNMTPEEFRWLATELTATLGIRVPPDKKIMLETRLRARLRALQLESFSAYFQYCQTPGGRSAELHQLVDLVTTHHTYFFRESEQFEVLVNELLPRIAVQASQKQRRPLQFWSAACSTGEEPYGLAMMLEDYASNHPRFDYRILATDVSERVLAHARAAVFDEALADAIPPLLRQRYLEWSTNRTKPTVRIIKPLRARLTFSRVNLAKDYPISDPFDFILLRNALIYFSPPMQKRLLERICTRLLPGGWLFIGLAETLDEISLPLRRFGRGIYQKT